MIDIITVIHTDRNRTQAGDMLAQLKEQADGPFRAFIVDNSTNNRGFGPACNLGAKEGSAPILGFLNPDCKIFGPFIGDVISVFENPRVVIAGNRFGKPQEEVDSWGLQRWVCGAAAFFRRSWFEQVGMFDEQFVWGWEESDLIMRAQRTEMGVLELNLPIHHESPADDTDEDREYKRHWLNQGWLLYRHKWGLPIGA